MAYGDFKDFTRRTASDKILRDKVFNIAKNSKYDGCKSEITSQIFKFFNKKTFSGVATLANKSAIKNENMSNNKLVEELHKPIIRKLNERKLHSFFYVLLIFSVNTQRSFL